MARTAIDTSSRAKQHVMRRASTERKGENQETFQKILIIAVALIGETDNLAEVAEEDLKQIESQCTAATITNN